MAPEVEIQSTPQVTHPPGDRSSSPEGEARRDGRAAPLRLARQAAVGSDRGLRRDAIFRRSLILADLIAASAALVAAGTWASPSWIPVVALPLVVLVAKLLSLYDRDDLVFNKSTLDEAPALLQLASLFALLTWFLRGVQVDGPVDPVNAVWLFGVFLVVVLCGRSVARRFAHAVSPDERCLLVGPTDARQRFARKLVSAQRGTVVAAHLALEEERRTPRRLPGRFERRSRTLSAGDFEPLIGELDIDRVVIIPGEASADKMLETVSRAKAVGVKISILPRMFEVVGSSVEFDQVEGVTVLGVRRFGLSRSSRVIKRSFDIALSGLALILLSPLLAAIALAVKLSTPGPVLFRQLRVGREGRHFHMLKFRSMVNDAESQREALETHNESQGVFKMASDPRVTRVGTILRRSSLDELMQLVNVLRGEMSLVGPRPLVVDEDRQVQGRHRGRLVLSPGMTGAWQLLGPTRVPLEDMVIMDYLYGANWSMWTDVKIVLRTIGHVFRQRGV